jgi:hypothetical protein
MKAMHAVELTVASMVSSLLLDGILSLTLELPTLLVRNALLFADVAFHAGKLIPNAPKRSSKSSNPRTGTTTLKVEKKKENFLDT